MKKAFFISISFLLIIGCQYNPYAHLYLTEKPTQESIVGTYQFDFQTLSDKIDGEKLKQRNSRIVLHSDQTYQIHKLPNFKEIDVLNYTYDQSVSLSGTWYLETIGSVSNGGDHSEKYWGVILVSAPEGLGSAGLIGDKKPNGIIFGYGDPDQGKVMLLEKVD